MSLRGLPVLAGLAVLCSCHAPPPAGRGDAAKGQATFRGYCATCHNADSREKKFGPGLKGLFHWDKMSNGKQSTDAAVRTQIDAGGNGMPPFKDMLTGQQEDDLIAYLKTL